MFVAHEPELVLCVHEEGRYAPYSVESLVLLLVLFIINVKSVTTQEEERRGGVLLKLSNLGNF